jgi:hypothetical protein
VPLDGGAQERHGVVVRNRLPRVELLETSLNFGPKRSVFIKGGPKDRMKVKGGAAADTQRPHPRR